MKQKFHQNLLIKGNNESFTNDKYCKVSILGEVSLEEYKEPSFNNLLGFNFENYLMNFVDVMEKQLTIWQEKSKPENVESENIDQNSNLEFNGSDQIDQWDYLMTKIDSIVYDIDNTDN